MRFISTRGKEKVTGAEAILMGFASDGGLFVPETIPQVSEEELAKMGEMNYAERAAFILGKFFGSELGDDFLLEACTGAYAQFVSGSYAVALYRDGREEQAVEVAASAVGNEYPLNNAVQYLLYESADGEDEEFLLSLTAYFTAKYEQVLATENTASLAPTVAMDAAYAYFILGDDYQTEYALWLSRA